MHGPPPPQIFWGDRPSVLPKSLPKHLSSALSLQTENCSLANPTLIHPFPHAYTSLHFSSPNTIHHSRLAVCLTLCYGLSDSHTLISI